HGLAAAVGKLHARELQAHRLGEAHAVGERIGGAGVVLHPSPARGRAQASRVHADEHPYAGRAVAMYRDGFAVPRGQEVFHLERSLVVLPPPGLLPTSPRGGEVDQAAFGCSTTARTRGATNRAVRTTPPVRVSSRTSTVVRELRTSTLRPARVASIVYSRAAPPPASTRTSTKSPFAMCICYSQFGSNSCVIGGWRNPRQSPEPYT